MRKAIVPATTSSWLYSRFQKVWLGGIAGAGEADPIPAAVGFPCRVRTVTPLSPFECPRCWRYEDWHSVGYLKRSRQRPGTASLIRMEGVIRQFHPDLDRISRHPSGIMVFYVIGFAAGHFDAERAERLFLHSFLKLIGGEHIGLLVRPFVLLVKFLSESIQRSITQRRWPCLYQPFLSDCRLPFGRAIIR